MLEYGLKEEVFEGEFDPTPDYVSLTNDLLFHMVFTMNERALRSLLSSPLARIPLFSGFRSSGAPASSASRVEIFMNALLFIIIIVKTSFG